MTDSDKPNIQPKEHLSPGGYLVDVIEVRPGGPYVLTHKLDPSHEHKGLSLQEAIAAGESEMKKRGYRPGQQVPRG